MRSGKQRLMSDNSALTDRATSVNHIIDWEGAKIIDTEANRSQHETFRRKPLYVKRN